MLSRWLNISSIKPDFKAGLTRNFSKSFTSPDNQIKVVFHLKSGVPYYQAYYKDEPLIALSRLGLEFAGDKQTSRFFLKNHEIKTHQGKIEMPWGENRYIEDTYTEAVFYLTGLRENAKLTLRFRIFDNTIAFRYELPKLPKITRRTVEKELTEFNLDPLSTCWSIPAYQPERYEYAYEKAKISGLIRAAHTPFTIKTPEGVYLSIHEAALYHYGAMNLKLNSAGVMSADVTPLADRSIAHINLPFETPWRLIMLADSAINLTKNQTMFALNPAPHHDFSWVKPLKFIGIWWAMYVGEWTWAPGEKHGATTKHTKEYIDAAVKLGISGLLIEGWNEGAWDGDWLLNGPFNQYITSTPDFDFDTVANYAKNHNIELVAHHETVGYIDNYGRQMSEAYNFLAARGIHYLKTGYANSMLHIHGREEYHESALGVEHFQKTVKLAAKKHICLDIHEPIKGTGIERTWPNLLSREGARGQEHEGGTLTPSHTCILPFTRLLSGGMDFTNGILDIENPVKRVNTTISRQLAYFIVIYSGMTMAADRPKIYKKYPRLFDFIKEVPVSFAASVPLAGEIGEYFVIARKDRDSANWFVGGITNESARDITLSFNFLDDDKTYDAKIYRDTADADYKTNPLAYEIIKQKITKDTRLRVHLAAGGGFAISLKPR